MFPALSGPLQIILKSVDLTKALINGVLLVFCFLLTFKSAESLVHLVERKVEEKGQREKWQRERFFSSLAVVKRELAERLEVLRDRCFPFKALSPAEERNVASMEFMRPSRRAPLKSFVIPYTHTCTQDSSHTPQMESFVMSSICPSIHFSSVSLAHLLSLVLCETILFSERRSKLMNQSL